MVDVVGLLLVVLVVLEKDEKGRCRDDGCIGSDDGLEKASAAQENSQTLKTAGKGSFIVY